MEKILKLYTYVDGVNDTPFPNEEEQVILGTFTYTAERMGGAPSIEATVEHRLCLDNLWSDKVYAEFNGEKYYVKTIPSSSKDNDSMLYEHSLELLSEREELNHVYFIDAVQGDSSVDVYRSNNTTVQFYGDITEFAERMNAALSYRNLDYTVVIDEGITSDEDTVSFENKYILEALQEFYNVFEIPYYFVGKTIHIGYMENAIPTVLRYGSSEALLSINKENANYTVINNVTGVGSSDNIPSYYPNTSSKGIFAIEVDETSGNIKDGDIIITDPELADDIPVSAVFTYGEYNDLTLTSSGAAAYVEETTFVQRTEGAQDDPVVYTSGWPDSFTIYLYADTTNNVLRSYPCELTMDIATLTEGYFSWSSGWNFPSEIEVSGVTLYRTSFSVSSTTVHATEAGTYKFACSFYYTSQSSIPSSYSSSISIALDCPITFSGNGWGLNGSLVSLSDYGLSQSVTYTPTVGDSFHRTAINYITTQDYLMPSVYRESLGAEMFIPAKNNTYEDGEGGYYEFENEFSETNRLEGRTEVEDIKPSIEGMTNAEGLRMDIFEDFAYDVDDSDEVDEEGNYLHPYFFAKLRKFDGDDGFNLFDQALADEDMQVSMTSGAVGGCTFTIMVGEETSKNTVQVDDNGDLIYDDNGNVLCGREDVQSAVDPQDRQNDTRNYSVWIALEKDTSTYPTVMPYENIRPTAGEDTFVLLGINMPLSYVTAAEKRLDEALIKYMWENNVDKFTFTLTFSRIYFEEHPDVLELLNENARLIIEYNGIEHTLYVESFTYKMDSSYPLPEIEVELADTLSVGQNSLQNAISSITSDILSGSGGGDFLKQGLKYFIRKDINDEAKGLITFKGGAVFGSNGYAEGLTGYGAQIDDDGNGAMESLTLRSFLEVPELRYNRVEIQLGDKWRAPGAGIIESVEPDTSVSIVSGQEVTTVLPSGTVTLHLEDGEIGAVAVDDICMGIFHDFENTSNNATEDSDDGRGNRQFAGFCTVYFRVTEILEEGSNSKFRYTLRGVDDRWSYQYHPCESMHFVAYGNFTDTDRQTSVYETRTYTRMLVDQKTWEIEATNIAMQYGDLSNLTVFGLSMSGYSIYLRNIYMTGTINQTSDDPYRVEATLLSASQLVNYGETVTITCALYKGWVDKSDSVTEWKVTRDSGNTTADTAWNTSDKATAFASTGTITLSYTSSDNDMGDNFASNGTIFSFTAKVSDGSEVGTQVLLKAYPSVEASTRYWLVIDKNVVNSASGTTDVTVQTMSQTGSGSATTTTTGRLTVQYYSTDGVAGSETELTNDSGSVTIAYDPTAYSSATVRYYVNDVLVDTVGVTTVEDGAAGEDAVRYWLIVDNYAPNVTNGNVVVTATTMKQVGSGTAEPTLEGTVTESHIGLNVTRQASRDDEGSWTFTVSSADTKVVVTFDINGVTVDTETVTPVYDGEEGAQGEDAVRYWLTLSANQLSATDGTSQTVTITKYVQVGQSDAQEAAGDDSGEVNAVVYMTSGQTVNNNGVISPSDSSGSYTINTSTVSKVVFNYVIGSAIVDSQTVSVVRDGEQGEQGEQGLDGCICRVSEWAEGVEYHNDQDLTSGTRYLDIAVITESATEFTAWQCSKTHVSDSTTKPGDSSAWEGYWVQFNQMAPIYTPLIMADYGVIRFTQTNQLLVMKSDGSTVAAGMGGGDYPLWVGATTPEDAPFRVTIDGKLYAEGAEISGTLVGVSGSFKELYAVDDDGNDTGAGISFYSLGVSALEFSGDLYHQGTVDSRPARFYSYSLYCRGLFGAAYRTAVLIDKSSSGVVSAYYFYDYGNISSSWSQGSYYQVALSQVDGTDYYLIPCYTGGTGYGVTWPSGSTGMPVDVVLLHSQIWGDTFKIVLGMNRMQRVLVVNCYEAHVESDNDYDTSYYTQYEMLMRGTAVTIKPAEVLEVISLRNFIISDSNLTDSGYGDGQYIISRTQQTY